MDTIAEAARAELAGQTFPLRASSFPRRLLSVSARSVQTDSGGWETLPAEVDVDGLRPGRYDLRISVDEGETSLSTVEEILAGLCIISMGKTRSYTSVVAAQLGEADFICQVDVFDTPTQQQEKE